MATTWRNCMQLLCVSFYTLHVLLHISTIILLVFLTFYTQFRYAVVLPVVLWTIYDWDTPHRGGRQYGAVKQFALWRHLYDYFPISLVKTADLDPNKNYIFCTHPHGILCMGSVANFIVGHSRAKEFFPGFKFFTATIDFNFYFPGLRDYFMTFGFVSASRKSLTYLLNDSRQGNVVNLMVGGAAEAYYTRPGEYRIILKKREGFVKIALKTGCSLVPVITFGENEILYLGSPLPGTWLAIALEWFKRKTGVTLCIPVGRSWFFLPKRIPLVTVVGKPIEIPKVPEPSKEEIKLYHSVYRKELFKLFEENKHKYTQDPEGTYLIIAE